MTNQAMTSQKLNTNESDSFTEKLQPKKTASTGKTHVHRVGSITLGLMLIVFGVLFILHMVLPQLSYEVIFRLWPVILISMGVEVLVSNLRITTEMKYDKGSVFLLIIMAFFSMCMAGVEVLMSFPWVQYYM